MTKIAQRLILLCCSLLPLASCTLPPVDVDLSVALASADQMTLRHSFALRRDALDGIEPYARDIRYYPSLTSTLEAAAGSPLGYFVIEHEGWLNAFGVQVDGVSPLQLSESEASLGLRIQTGSADAYRVVHSRREAAGQEKLAIFRARPVDGDFSAGALATGFVDGVRADSLSDELFGGDPVVAAGSYAAAWPPLPPDTGRLAALTLVNNIVGIERVGLGPAAFGPVSNIWQADVPPAELAYGRVVLRHIDVLGVTLAYAGFADANRYRTFVSSDFDVPDAEYRELPISGRLETVLAGGEVLTRTRDSWAVWSASGEPRGSFAAGRLQFVHERNDIDGTEWHALFTLTYWGRVDDQDYLFVRVYSVASAELHRIK